MFKVVNPFDSTGFAGKKKADQTGRRNFFGSGGLESNQRPSGYEGLFLSSISGFCTQNGIIHAERA